MRIDGVDFWGSNRHTIRMWDHYDSIGPFVVLIDERVRVRENFTVYLQGDQHNLYRFLQRQADMKHVCDMLVAVQEPKTHQLMYSILFRVTLVGIQFGLIDYTDNEPTELHLTYRLIDAFDHTVYDKTL